MARAGGSKRGRGTRVPRSVASENVMPDVYRDMLADAVSSSPTKFDEEAQPVKRRRVGGRVVMQALDDTTLHQSDQAPIDATDTDIEQLAPKSQAARRQISYTESDDSADSDVDWEEVDLKNTNKDLSEHDAAENQELSLVLGGDDHDVRRPPAPRRKPASAADKKLRLEIHKMHLLSLLVHVHRRNHWCNDEEVHKALRKLLCKRTISYLNPDSQESQFQRSQSFADGLDLAIKGFREKFKITARGMSRSYWADSPKELANASLPEDLDLPIQKSDFRETAGTLNASRDVGAQLFCALLRSAGVDARMVCSLQPLPFATVARGTTPQKSVPMVFANPESRTATSGDESGVDATSDAIVSVPRAVGSVGGRNRFASPNNGHSRPVPNINSQSNHTFPKSRPKPKRIKESPYPIYWIEAFNEAYQKWIPVDPLVTNSTAKPSKLEPPASDPENQLSYVVAFEDDGSARDVTRRYAKAYNAKTRRERVEVTKGGEKWWRKVMRMYRRDHDLDRDQVEDAQLAQKEAQEGMPKNVQDFKDHPYYALERHLRRSEVIHPKREVGKVATGKSGGEKVLEPIYRRHHVHEVKSADKWYRMGREIKTGEQPLKRVPARRQRGSAFDEDQTSEDEESAGTSLYAAFQTTTYHAPPVVNGRVPRNVYGNLDVYVSSMVPAGGAHLSHLETARAAKILGVDYVDAVTGFAFKGRHGTAIIKGAVVATQYREAVEEVIQAFEDERTEAEEARRSAEALRMWRRLLAGLRIRERIEAYEVEGERDALREGVEEADKDDEEAGGFLPDRDAGSIAEPTAGRVFMHDFAGPQEGEGGGFMDDSAEYGGAFIEDDEAVYRNKDTEEHQGITIPLMDIEDNARGGFCASDRDEDAEEARREKELADPHDSEQDISEQGGGFLPDEAQDTPDQDLRVTAQNSSPEPSGGFLPKNDDNDDDGPTAQIQPPSAKDPQPSLPHPIPHNQEPARASSPKPGLGDADLAEATTPEIRCEPSQPDAALAPLAGEHPLEAARGDMPGIARDTEDDPAREEEETSDAEPESPGSDAGSLLSHDPDDEDADPEWLV